MDTAIELRLDAATDQELVDVYVDLVPSAEVTALTESQIFHASAAAYRLERKGYLEQAGTWHHSHLPSLTA